MSLTHWTSATKPLHCMAWAISVTANTFLDALFFLADKVQRCGATLVGEWPTVGYDYTQSWAVNGDRFLGLALDQHNQPDLTELRIRIWVQQLTVEFDLVG
ncbi:MAG: hypothetical protein R2932_22400 [Caldilineaceae bacterium]